MCTYIYIKISHICLHVLGQIWTQRLFPQLLHKRTHTHAHTHFSLSLSLSLWRPREQIYTLCFGSLWMGQENRHKCLRCGIVRTQRLRSGYSNLKDHLQTEHPDWQETMKVFYAEGRGPMDTYVSQASSKAKSIHGWLEWTIMDNNSFSFCEGKLTRKYSTLNDVSSKTLMKYVKLTADKVRDKVALALPESFGLIIDGWSSGSDHYSGLFASFVKNGVVHQDMRSAYWMKRTETRDERSASLNSLNIGQLRMCCQHPISASDSSALRS